MTRALYGGGGGESTWPIFPIFHLLLFQNKASLEKEQWKLEPCFSKWDQRGVGLVLTERQNLRSHTRPAEKDPTFNKVIYSHSNCKAVDRAMVLKFGCLLEPSGEV